MLAQQEARSPEWVAYLLCIVGIWAILVGVYVRAGSFHAEFAGADEAAYVVSSIMVREYLAGPLWHGVSPIAFAQLYYDNYPKVAIGHWPPVYFVVQSAWLLLTGVSRPALLVLSALLSTLLASLTMLLCRREGLRWSMAATAGVVTVLLPIHIRSLLELGSDIMASITILVATLCCQRWIAQQNRRNSMWFAASVAIAVLTKGTAFVLFLVAPMALLLTQKRLASMWSRETWRVVMWSVVLALPWYFFAARWLQGEIVPGPPGHLVGSILNAVQRNTWTFLSLCGIAMLPMALVSLRSEWHRRAPAVAVLPIATWLFLTILSPHTEARLFMPMVPGVVFAGAVAASSLLPRIQELVMIAALLISYVNVHVTTKAAVGFLPAVAWMVSAPHEPSRGILVSSNGGKEGALISEFALRQPLPQRAIVRASKVLESSTWMGDNAQLLARSAADAARIVDEHHISLVVRHVSPSGATELYGRSLDEMLSHWQLLREFGEVRIYGRTH